jgi:di/tricarboxylate transporter
MTASRIGFVVGLALFLVSIVVPPPADMPREAWFTAGLVLWMAAWWMTEAIPLTATALLPFIVLPLAGIMTAKDTASAYYDPILFLILGGAFIALAIERYRAAPRPEGGETIASAGARVPGVRSLGRGATGLRYVARVVPSGGYASLRP